MNDRFKWIPKWHNPVFFPERLEEPFKHKKPACIFVGSMCDLFGEWVCGDWIKQVLMVCEQNPKHTFLFLTKNPRRYLSFDFPSNVMLGVTVTHFSLKATLDCQTMKDLAKKYKTFASIEPIMSGFNEAGYSLFRSFDLLIIGAMTGRGAIKPQREWIDSIQHPNIYYKSNIRKLFPELKNQ
jgi:protein gp37